MAANLNVTRENVLNLSNVDLKAFLKSIGETMSVTKGTRDAAEKLAIAHFAASEAPKADAAPIKDEREGAYAFPKNGTTGAVVVIEPGQAPAGWDKVGTSTEDTGGATGQEASGESEADEAARIEAEARAEAEATEAATKRAQARASNSVGVALSWKNPETRAARLTRDGVQVVGVDKDGKKVADGMFKSTKDAFREYRLPLEKHIKFRLGLKAARTATIEKDGVTYTFTM